MNGARSGHHSVLMLLLLAVALRSAAIGTTAVVHQGSFHVQKSRHIEKKHATLPPTVKLIDGTCVCTGEKHRGMGAFGT
jgi:hypothetical protein